jgi:multidrug efflux pump subunit AcrA (membrane-fusion protein)
MQRSERENLVVPPHPDRTSVLVLLSLALLGFLVSKCSDNAPSAHITTAQVSIGPITRRIVATGTLQPAKMVDASAQVFGTVQGLAVDFNSRCPSGGGARACDQRR